MANHLIHPEFIDAYVYAITVDGVVRYIGKGRRYRATEHLRFARELNRRRANGEKVNARYFYNKLAKAIRTGSEVGYKIIVNGLDDVAALRREVLEIEAAPAGQLWNTDKGGVGTDRHFMKQMWAIPHFRERLTEARRKSHSAPEFRQKQREITNRKWADPDFRKRWMKSHRSIWDDPISAERRRALLKKVWSDPEKSKRKSELVKSQWTPERRAAMSANRKAAWADPVFRARASASIRNSKKK